MPAATRPAHAYWADEIAGQVSGRQVVNDSKTPSGTVHVGSLRGVVLHDAIRRAVAPAWHGRRVPLRHRRSRPDGRPVAAHARRRRAVHGRAAGACPSAGRQHRARTTPATSPTLFLETFADLGIHPHLYWMSRALRLWRDGHIHGARARPRRHDPRDLPHRVHGQPSRRLAADQRHLRELRPDRHHAALRLGRQRGQLRVPARSRRPGPRAAASSGRVSPFGGRAKMVWNVDWAARWGLVGATIEGCGKDLATAGGSRDRADAISRRVFDREPPLNVPYEFLNIGGKKMSTSKGHGAAAHAMADLLPPDLTALPVPAPPAQQGHRLRPVEATPFRACSTSSTASADAVAGRAVRGELPPDPDRIFCASRWPTPTPTRKVEAARFRPPFRTPGTAAPGARPGHRWSAWRPRRARLSTTPSRTSLCSASPRAQKLARDARARIGTLVRSLRCNARDGRGIVRGSARLPRRPWTGR